MEGVELRQVDEPTMAPLLVKHRPRGLYVTDTCIINGETGIVLLGL